MFPIPGIVWFFVLPQPVTKALCPSSKFLAASFCNQGRQTGSTDEIAESSLKSGTGSLSRIRAISFL